MPISPGAEVKAYLGDISFYLEQHEMESMREVEMRNAQTNKVSRSNEGRQMHLDLKEKKKLQNKLSKVESEISKLEHQIIHDDAEISENFERVQADENFFKLYQEKKDKLSELMESWEILQEQIESL